MYGTNVSQELVFCKMHFPMELCTAINSEVKLHGPQDLIRAISYGIKSKPDYISLLVSLETPKVFVHLYCLPGAVCDAQSFVKDLINER
jgi:hypothetical protein